MAEILVNVGEHIEPAEEAALEAFLRALDDFHEVDCYRKGYARLHVRYTGLAYGYWLQRNEPGCAEATRLANERWRAYGR